VLEECWRTQSYPYPVAIELAKLLEHQARDFNAARRIVGDALRLLALAAVPNPQWRADLERRLQRLDRRLNQGSASLSLLYASLSRERLPTGGNP